jgi:hypothetical protein
MVGYLYADWYPLILIFVSLEREVWEKGMIVCGSQEKGGEERGRNPMLPSAQNTTAAHNNTNMEDKILIHVRAILWKSYRSMNSSV